MRSGRAKDFLGFALGRKESAKRSEGEVLLKSGSQVISPVEDDLEGPLLKTAGPQ